MPATPRSGPRCRQYGGQKEEAAAVRPAERRLPALSQQLSCYLPPPVLLSGTGREEEDARLLQVAGIERKEAAARHQPHATQVLGVSRYETRVGQLLGYRWPSSVCQQYHSSLRCSRFPLLHLRA